MSIRTTIIAALAGVSAIAGVAGSASAEGRWGYKHPRQREVLARAHHEERAARIDFRDGLISRRQAMHDINSARRVAREDRFFAPTKRGYTSRGEQRFMNRQENQIAHRVY